MFDYCNIILERDVHQSSSDFKYYIVNIFHILCLKFQSTSILFIFVYIFFDLLSTSSRSYFTIFIYFIVLLFYLIKRSVSIDYQRDVVKGGGIG